jgi:endonuclease/exonuclease/phosphatase family metal-dependent hydrolase
MREVETIEAVDELGTVGHGDLFRMPVERVESHAREDGVAQRGSLFQKVTRRGFAPSLVRRTPFIHD